VTLTPPPHRPQANNPASEDNRIIPEQMSLSACKHIRTYMGDRTELSKEELNAVLRLSQHLRVFGLLSATGYVNQSNSQEGRVRERTVPVWSSLLGQLIDEDNPPNRRQIMETVRQMAANNPTEYMINWRKSLILANHWNFWARAYAGDE
jgi:hypothetical protein